VTVVVGTAGHIDHGKTTLLRALTGIDADRLPEERRRGMTIEVGYAHLLLPDSDVLDFVDVPGHDRLVGNMLVGAGEIDAVLLVVAADDGPRAQTREHVELLDALGVCHALVAITKVDAVDDARVAEVQEAIAALLAPTTLDGAPIVAASGVTGEGIDALLAALVGLRDRARADGAGAPGPARLAVDRVFGVKGRGTVVTGTLRGGPVGLGAALRLEPGGVAVRARELQARGRPIDVGGPGGRLAMNLAGVERAAVIRGAVLTDDAAVLATDRMLVSLRPALDLAAGGARRNLPAAGTAVRVHLGTAQVEGVIRSSRRVVDDLPGGGATAILRLAAPIAAAPGDRFVLRRPSPAEPLAGGRVLDPRPPTGAAWRRATAAEVAALARAASPSQRATALLALHGALPRSRLEIGELPQGGGVAAGRLVLAPAVASELIAAALAAVGSVPDAGVSLAELRVLLGRALRRHASVDTAVAGDAVGALVEALVAAGRLARTGDLVHLPGRVIALPAAVLAAMDRLEAALDTAAPPSLPEAARAAGCPPPGLRALEESGRIVRVDEDLAWSAPMFARLQTVALRLATPGPLTPAALRDAIGTSRKYVMALLEELNRRGVLARTPEGHVRGPRAAP
jgi:selenocysteine-specific elongation factor